MRESIKNSVDSRDYRQQTYKDTDIAKLIARIDQWTVRTKKVKIDLETLNINYLYESKSLHDMIVFCICANKCSLDHPIIVSNEWEVIDWRHRIAKAIIEWKEYIEAVMILDYIKL